MNSKTALCMALLEGRILNVKNVFITIGLTNASREISRMIEQPFGVIISRQNMEGKSRYGQPVRWVNYRLNRDADYNQEGIAKMRDYVEKHKDEFEPEIKQTLQQQLF